MSKPSSSRFLVRSFHHHIATKPSTTVNKTTTGISQLISNNPKIVPNSSLSSWLSTPQRTHFSSSPNLGKANPHANLLKSKNFTGFRYFPLKNHEMGLNFAQKLIKKPTLTIKSAFTRYKEAVVLQIEAFWKRNYLGVIGCDLRHHYPRF